MGLKILTTHTKKQLCEVMDVLTNLTVVIILQYIHIANYCAVYLKLYSIICQLYFKKAGEKSSVDISGRNEMEEKMHYSLREECKKLTSLLC